MKTMALTGSDLKSWREEKRKTLREVAQHFGTSPSTVLRWEKSGQRLNPEGQAAFERLREQGQPEVLRIARSNDLWSTLVVVAASKETSSGKTLKTRQSFFEEEGVIVEVKSAPTGKDAHSILLDGAADAATVSDRVILAAAMTDTIALATIVEAPPLYAVAVKDVDELRSYRTLSDFRGKTIAFVAGTIADHVIADHLGEIQDPNDWPKMRPYNRPDPIYIAKDLAADQVNLFIGWQPYISATQSALSAEGFSGRRFRLQFLSSTRIRFYFVIARRVALRPAVAKGVARALLRADEFVKGNRDSTLRILRETLGPESLGQVPDWEEYHFTVNFPGSVLLNYLII